MSGLSGRTPRSQPIKTVVVYRNGDAHFPGRRFVVNPRQVSTFDSFLNAVTRGVDASFGAVRNLYTPRAGHKIFSLDNLQHGETYVAAGTERFKKLDYFQITPKKPTRKRIEEIKPVVHSRIIVPARWRRILHESCTINVFTNGEILVPPARILIPKHTLQSWDRVLAMVTERVHLRTGAVHRLCRVDGTPLCRSADLENNHYYIATGPEKLQVLPYILWVKRKGVVEDSSRGVHRDFLLPTMMKGKRSSDLFADPRFHADSLFYAKPKRRAAKQWRHVFKTPHLLSSGEDGVFKARKIREENAGASEVPEDARLQVDLPIDQVKARVVEEEVDVSGAAETEAVSLKPSNSDQGSRCVSTVRTWPADCDHVSYAHTPDSRTFGLQLQRPRFTAMQQNAKKSKH